MVHHLSRKDYERNYRRFHSPKFRPIEINSKLIVFRLWRLGQKWRPFTGTVRGRPALGGLFPREGGGDLGEYAAALSLSGLS
jgi:hypothetical protein